MAMVFVLSLGLISVSMGLEGSTRPNFYRIAKLRLQVYPVVSGVVMIIAEINASKNNSIKSGLERSSAVKNACCSCREPGFGSQHPQVDTELSVTAGPGDLTPFFWPPSHVSKTLMPIK